jgi:ribosomal protein L20
VNPQRHQARNRRVRPSDYRELWVFRDYLAL